jgi:hypothetical protein
MAVGAALVIAAWLDLAVSHFLPDLRLRAPELLGPLPSGVPSSPVSAGDDASATNGDLPQSLRTSINLRPALPASARLDDTTPAGAGAPTGAVEPSAPVVDAGLDAGMGSGTGRDGLLITSSDDIPRPGEDIGVVLDRPVPPGVAASWADPDALAMWNRASELIRDGRDREALGVTEALIAHHPTDAGVWHVRACALTAAGQPEVGSRLLRAVLGADRSNALAWYNLGVARLKMGDQEGADRAFLTFSDHADDPAFAELRRRVDRRLVSRHAAE